MLPGKEEAGPSLRLDADDDFLGGGGSGSGGGGGYLPDFSDLDKQLQEDRLVQRPP